MSQPSALAASPGTIWWNKVKTFFSKPYNVILLVLGIVLTVTTVAPIIAIVEDTFKIHAGTIDAHLTGQASGWTIVNYTDLFTSKLAKTNLWTPLINTVYLAVGTCVVSILYGGIFAFLITRTNMAFRNRGLALIARAPRGTGPVWSARGLAFARLRVFLRRQSCLKNKFCFLQGGNLR